MSTYKKMSQNDYQNRRKAQYIHYILKIYTYQTKKNIYYDDP